MVTDSATVTMESLYETTIALSNGAMADPYDLTFPPNGGIMLSPYGDPIHFMFCSRVEFSGTADLMALFPVRTNPRWRPPPS